VQLDQNILIVGDSFCASTSGWPSQLATLLNLQLISHGLGGQSWWNAREFVNALDSSVLDRTQVMVFVHTNADRIPTHNTQIGLIDHSAHPRSDIEIAVQLYYKYIHDSAFLNWAQQQWFLEINQRWGHKKVVHLHSFPWSIKNGKLLTGLNIETNLCSISLNELGTKEFTLFNDLRANHLNQYNNTVLAQQLSDLICNYRKHTLELNNSLFDLQTQRWFDWY
jgi:hypothetical protein